MTALVTGATGFTGGHMARTLAARGERVRAIVRPRSLDKPAVAALRALGIEVVPVSYTHLTLPTNREV